MKHLKCACCEETIRPQNPAYIGDTDTHYEGKTLCESCYYDDEPVATILYGRDEETHRITIARNETEGDFRANWHSTDPWRGYYELTSGKYTRILTDALLSYHESEAMLKDLNDKTMKEFDERQIGYARAFTRTSNVFSTGYDIWVRNEPEQILIAHLSLEHIKKEVNFSNPLYSTGILMGREEFSKMQGLLKGKYEIKNDHDLMNLVSSQGEQVLSYIQKLHQHDDKQR